MIRLLVATVCLMAILVGACLVVDHWQRITITIAHA